MIPIPPRTRRSINPKKMSSDVVSGEGKRPLIAFLGPVGTFSHGAVLRHFGDDARLLDLATIDDVFAAVEGGTAEFGVVPVENSTEGAVNNTLDCLVDTRLRIVGEEVVRIVHHFMFLPGSDPAALTKVVSHKQSLAQCRKWLARHWPRLPQAEVASNAEAARIASLEPHTAAIAGEMASIIYQLEIGSRAIQDQHDNSTRFLVLGKQPVAATGHDKTSTLIYTQNKPGALFRVLEPFERHQVSLTRIETRPSRKAVWDYVFFVDFEGHEQDEPVQQVLAALATGIAEVKLLGSYPVARP